MPKFFGNIFFRKPSFLSLSFEGGGGAPIKKIDLSERAPIPRIKVQENAHAANSIRGIRANTTPKKIGLSVSPSSETAEISKKSTDSGSHPIEDSSREYGTYNDQPVSKGKEFGSKWTTESGATILHTDMVKPRIPESSSPGGEKTTSPNLSPTDNTSPKERTPVGAETTTTPENQIAKDSPSQNGESSNNAHKKADALRSFYKENNIPFTEEKGENGSTQLRTQATLDTTQQEKFNTLLKSFDTPKAAAEALLTTTESKPIPSGKTDALALDEIPVAVGASPQVPKNEPTVSNPDASMQLEKTLRERMGTVAGSSRESSLMADPNFHGDEEFTPQIFAPTQAEIRQESALYQKNKVMMPAESGQFMSPTVQNANVAGRNAILGGPDAVGDNQWSRDTRIDPKIHLYGDPGHQVPVVFGPKNAAGLRPMYEVRNMSTDGTLNESGIIKNGTGTTDLRQQNDIMSVQGGDNKTYFLKPLQTVGRLMRNLYNTPVINPSNLSIPTGEQFQ